MPVFLLYGHLYGTAGPGTMFPDGWQVSGSDVYTGTRQLCLSSALDSVCTWADSGQPQKN